VEKKAAAGGLKNTLANSATPTFCLTWILGQC